MTYELKVENIKCNGCAHSIKTSLAKLKDVENVEVDIEHGTIHLDTEEENTLKTVIEKLHGMGYPQPGMGTGMTTAVSYISCMIGKVTS